MLNSMMFKINIDVFIPLIIWPDSSGSARREA